MNWPKRCHICKFLGLNFIDFSVTHNGWTDTEQIERTRTDPLRRTNGNTTSYPLDVRPKFESLWNQTHLYFRHFMHAVTSNSLCVRILYLLIPLYLLQNIRPTLRYKTEGRGFDSRWCHCNFSLTQSFRPHYGPGVNSASNGNEY
jgi:hypothetical protein